MNAFVVSSIVASAVTAAIVGLAGPANADIGHNQWVNQMSSSSTATAPHVDTTVRH